MSELAKRETVRLAKEQIELRQKLGMLEVQIRHLSDELSRNVSSLGSAVEAAGFADGRGFASIRMPIPQVGISYLDGKALAYPFSIDQVMEHVP